MNVWMMATEVLRAPLSVVTDKREELLTQAPALLALSAGGMATWALAVASYRGGLQLAYAPLKAPLLVWVPLAVCLPVMRVLFDPSGDRLTSARVGSAGLVGMARAALFAAAVSPMLWLWLSVSPSYHVAVVGMAASLGVSLLPGLWTLTTALRGERRAWMAQLICVGLLGAMTAQAGWVFRPFVARPTTDVTLFRAVESDVASSLLSTSAQAVGGSSSYESRPAGVIGRAMAEEE